MYIIFQFSCKHSIKTVKLTNWHTVFEHKNLKMIIICSTFNLFDVCVGVCLNYVCTSLMPGACREIIAEAVIVTETGVSDISRLPCGFGNQTWVLYKRQ